MKQTNSNQENRTKNLLSFCKKADLPMKNMDLLDLAFYHRSKTNENKKGNPLFKIYGVNNERLEFLGDSVLGMVTASWLFENLPEKKEGELSKIKSVVVSEKTLAPNALRLGMDKLLLLGHGEELTGGRSKPAILADCVEAVIGACYLECGIDAARKFVLSFIVPEVSKVLENGTKDYKTLLQEFTQKKFKETPVYELLDAKGPEHDKVFTVRCKVGKNVFEPVKGSSKKNAEMKAAEEAFKILNS